MKLFYVILSVFVIKLVVGNSRVKRILYGDLFNAYGADRDLRNWKSSYEAIYYSVTMKLGWGTTVFETDWNDVDSAWIIQSKIKKQFTNSIWGTRCGGSFLTPMIVQTACHCVAHFYPKANAEEKHIWEEPMVIMANVDLETWYRPRRYYAHKKCRGFRSYTARLITYDYGLIVLATGTWGFGKASNTFPPRARNIRAAPIYAQKELNFHYRNILRKQSICLHIGHGYNRYSNKSGLLSFERKPQFGKNNYNVPQTRAERLPRHTWRHVANYNFCYDYVMSVLDYIEGIVHPDSAPKVLPESYEGPERYIEEYFEPVQFKFDTGYRSEGTFACSMNAGKSLAVPTVGDGGYPVTCNNIYFAVQGQGWTRWTRMDRMSLENPVVYSKWENSLEFRQDLVDKLQVQWYDVKKGFFKFAATAAREQGMTATGSKSHFSSTLLSWGFSFIINIRLSFSKDF